MRSWLTAFFGSILVSCGILVITLLLVHHSSHPSAKPSQPPTTALSQTSSPSQPTPPVTPPSPTSSPPAPSAPPTHSCRVLADRGMSYADVLVYWQNLGRPADMDDDSDGLPCETVFGQQNAGLPELVGGTHSCSKLSELGFSYADTRTYWLGLGAPADMDDDHDGKPCESVYGQR